MKLIDVHAHLEDGRFEKDLDSVIERFKEAGGKFVINSGTDPEKNRKTLELFKSFDCVRCSFGMYPIGDYEDVDGELVWIEEHKDVCVAVGEIGLDFDKGREDFEKQEKLFRKMLRFAKKIDKPVVIHSRKAELEVIDILEEEGFGKTASLPDRGGAPARPASPARPLRCQTAGRGKVVMHCFSGKKSLIRRCVENGWSFSVPAVIMRLEHFKMLVEMVPLEQLLTETDAPYLSPVVGERNEPVNVAVTIKEIARIKGVSEDEVAERIWENAERVFKI